jgi:E3 ubiquitin-protein ligase TRIP12
MMAGSSTSRFRYLLDGLRRKDDPDKQLVAVQELSEILLISNEDNLAGQFSPDAFVKELVSLMQPNELTGEQHPEIMLLACRSLANMMEALPASTASVVYGGAVSVLCQKLLEIDYIDLAEQALSTLEKISIEYPASIVREGGLTACLSYLDFFATGTQRVAVTTAANCCRNIPEDSFPVIKDVMPILLNVLGSSDQRVVEQGSLCVSRIVESFRNQPARLEELVSVDLLKAILRLLLPGATNLIGPNIHTQFIRVLAFTARASPRLSAELFKMNIVETLYQILTGVSPPSGTEDVASKLDSVLIMQALIHRPREQVLETLNVVCELLPSEPEIPAFNDRPGVLSPPEPSIPSSTASRRNSSNEKRIELLEGCKAEVKRFALILFPTLTDAFSSTVNLSVRQKVLTAQLKMLSNLDVDILEEALKAVPFASFLASILSQQDHPTLVMSALLATELLLRRLDNIYRYQLYREGVLTEITKLATEAVEEPTPAPSEQPPTTETQPPPTFDQDTSDDDDDGDDEEHQPHHSSDEEENEGNDDEDEEDEIHQDDGTNSEGSTMSLDAPRGVQNSAEVPMKSRIALVAKRFLAEHETEKQGKAMKKKALKILNTLSSLAGEIETLYTQRGASPVSQPSEHGVELFRKLSSYFDTDVLESVTSAELLASGVVKVLERIFSNPDEELAAAAQADFLHVFMGHSVKSKPKTGSADSPATPFSIMIHKLQDLLSRSEHFEVLTVHQNAMDGNRSSATSMLAKQIRLKLAADESSGIPAQYRNVMVSIHAITTFKSLEDYLRPRISMNDRPSRSDAISRALASMVGASGARGMPPGFPFGGAGRLSAGDGLSAFMPSDALQRALGSFGGGPPGMSAGLGMGDLQTTQGRHRHYRKRRDAKGDPKQDAPATPEPSSSNGRSLRRSSRRQPTTDDAAASAPPVPPASENDLENALECADEKQMSDDEDDDDEMADMAAEEEELRLLRDLDAGMDMDMDDMDEEMDEHDTPERSAVNLEVAAGGNITARKEDGTRVPTPSQTRPLGSLPNRTSALAAALAHSPSPSSSSRPALSYAGALQATPKDWHLEFSIDGKVIPNDTTIYRAVHRSAMSGDDHTRANVWTNLHSVKFKRVPGPAPEPSGVSFGSGDSGAEAEEGATPGSLAKHPATTSILRLLKMLHDLNANIDDVIVENKETLKLNVEPLSQFVNTKLTAKLNRQLEEPLIVASNCLPSWSEDLARLYPFLFPFETRHLFLQSTSFGYARSMTRWQAAQSQEETRRDRRDERPFLGRLQRQKVRISRSKILESAIKVMELYGAAQHILEVEYFDEVGTGLGPTLEFFSSVSKEFSKKKLKLWRENDAGDGGEYVNGANGLFPRPLSSDHVTSEDGEKILQLFKVLGKFVARSMIDSRIIDINFNPIFFRIGEETSGVRPSLGAVKAVDPMLAKSLTLIKKFALARKEIEEHPNRTAAQKVADMENIIIGNTKIDDLCLDFTLPGSPEIELISNGAQVALTIDNVDLYLERVVDMTLGSGVRRQVDAFRAGFSEVFPYSALSAFTPDELCILFGRTDEDWSLESKFCQR